MLCQQSVRSAPFYTSHVHQGPDDSLVRIPKRAVQRCHVLGDVDLPSCIGADVSRIEGAAPDQTRTYRVKGSDAYGSTVEVWTTNDVPGCPNGGLLSGTEKTDKLGGKEGDDEIHGLGGEDAIKGEMGSDVIYGGPGLDLMSGGTNHDVLHGGDGNDRLWGDVGEDVLYGGDGNDTLFSAVGYNHDHGADKLCCGPGIDHYVADRLDYVDSSCEKKVEGFGGGGLA